MKKLIVALAMVAAFLLVGLTGVNAITIDGTMGSGEWDGYLLGTSTTTWQGGMSVDVYCHADSSDLYAAYVADTSRPGWTISQILCIGSNLDFRSPSTISWPQAGYTHVGFFGDGFGQTDGTSWIWPDSYGNGDWIGRGIVFVAGHPCGWGTVGTPSYPAGPNANVVEIKIPLTQLTYIGSDGQVGLSGQYWQYDWATAFYCQLPPADADGDGLTEDVDCDDNDPEVVVIKDSKACILYQSGVPGGGILTAPGLQKLFNPNSKAGDNAGKK